MLGSSSAFVTDPRYRVFRRGVEALRNVIGIEDELYGCPLCVRGFPRESVEQRILTWEHVPPDSIGGKRLLLTCQACNSTSGHSLDAAIAAREEINQFIEALVLKGGEFNGRLKLRMSDEILNTHVTITDGEVTMEVREGNNDPAGPKRLQESLDRHVEDGTWEGSTFQLSTHTRYNNRYAKLGDLRVGFLAAFARLGYRYAYSQELAPVRRQLQSPDEEILPDGFWTFLGWDQERTRGLRLISEPFPMILIQIDRQAVVLPGLRPPKDPWSRLREVVEPGQRLNLTGLDLGWPSRLEMALDFTGEAL